MAATCRAQARSEAQDVTGATSASWAARTPRARGAVPRARFAKKVTLVLRAGSLSVGMSSYLVSQVNSCTTFLHHLFAGDELEPRGRPKESADALGA